MAAEKDTKMAKTEVKNSITTDLSSIIGQHFQENARQSSNKDDKEMSDLCLPRLKSPENPILSGGYQVTTSRLNADFTPANLTRRKFN